MEYEECATSHVCTVRGIASYTLAEHAPMARLDIGGGRCINVSFPRLALERLRVDGPTETTVTGTVYSERALLSGGDAVLEISGRRIGLGTCGDFFVYVR